LTATFIAGRARAPGGLKSSWLSGTFRGSKSHPTVVLLRRASADVSCAVLILLAYWPVCTA